MSENRVVPAGESVGEHEDRGSRFLTFLFHAPDEDAFRARLEGLRGEYPKARHHCWAWSIGAAYRFSDDGEPGGTAGRPMLLVLESSGLSEVGAVCIRWFGGVKLGTGGLARAYTAATARAVDAGERREIVPRASLPLRLPFDLLGLRGEIETLFPSARFSGEFDEQSWAGRVDMETSDLPRLDALLQERARGRAEWGPAEDC